MNNRKQWDIYFREHKYPCFIIDRYTNEILYCNNKFNRVVEINKDPVGQKFFDVVMKRDVHIEGESPNWDEVDYFETQSYNKKLNRKFILKSIKMEDGKSIFCEMVALEHTLYDNELFEKAVTECMGYYETNTGKLLKKIMRLLTEFYSCERAYIYSFYSEDNTINCVEQWCESEEFRVTEEIGTKVDAGKIKEWLEGDSTVGIVHASGKESLDKNTVEYEVLDKFQLDNVSICNIVGANNQLVGFVGISNRQDPNAQFDPRLLHTVSRLVAQEVGEDKLKSDLEELHYKDKLTGLYNRAGYAKKLQKMVFPDQFIPVYEEKAVIRHLDMFVLESVCKLQKEWVKIGKKIPISVNFSRITLQEYGIVNAIAEVCDKYEVPHELVVIEITERVGLINNNVASALVTDFKEQGFHLSLDDFGCAYSNIITLAQIEVDEVKIDKSLVDFILCNKKNKVLVKSILAMCNELGGIATLAEGIETSRQGDLLHLLGCTLGQGYHFSRPIPVDEFVEKYI